MSTAAHAIASPFALAGMPRTQPPAVRRPSDQRQSTPEQARALQTITHAIEHLVDSRLFDTWQTPSDAEAVHILMTCSREVFNECRVMRAWPVRMGERLKQSLQLQAHGRQGGPW